MKRILLPALILLFNAAHSQNVGIGTGSPAAKLDITSTNSGVLIPRVALTGSNDVSTVPSPATSTLIYNTSAAGTSPNAVVPGFYYWNGSAWVLVIDNSSLSGTTTVSNTSSVNTLSTTVNGVTGSTVPIINSNALSLSGNNLSTTINGIGSTAQSLSGLTLTGDVTGTLAGSTVAQIQGTPVTISTLANGNLLQYNSSGTDWVNVTPASVLGAATTNTLSLSTNTLTSTVNGVAATSSAVSGVNNTSSANTLSTTVNGVTGSTVPIVNSISNTSSANTLTTTVNGQASTGAPIINSNTLGLSGTTLTSTINGVASSGLNLSSLDNNIYNSDGTLTGNRTVTLGVDNLTFSSSTGNLIFNPSSTGYVGIGTPSPVGNIDIEATTANTYGHLVVNRNNAGAVGGELSIDNLGGGTGASAVLGFGTDNSTVFDGSGNNQNNAEIRAVNTNGSSNSTDLRFSNWSGSAENTNMAITSAGNVGIGTTSPAYSLDVNGNGRFNSGGSNYVYVGSGGGGYYGDAANIVTQIPIGGSFYMANVGLDGTRVSQSDGTLRVGGPSQTTANLYVYGSAGIGTITPAYMLDVAGRFQVDGANDGALYMTGTRNTNHGIEWYYGTNDRYGLCQANGGNVALYTSSAYGPSYFTFNLTAGAYNSSTPFTELIRITHAGYMGIATTNPTVPLYINTSSGFNQGNYSYYAYSSGGSNTGNASCNGCGVSMYATGRVEAAEFDANSDQRIKRDFKPSNSKEDIETLNKIEVTDFKYKDEVVNSGNYKKGFIAQQVEGVFPQAVSTHTDFVTDVYAKPEKVTIADSLLTVSMKDIHGFCDGDKVRFITPSGKQELPVKVKDDYTFTVDHWPDSSKGVFVYGKETDDFMAVDYDRIYTLNVSATQELSRQLKDALKKIEALEAENKQLKSSSVSKEDFDKLKTSVETMQQIIGIRSEK